MSETTLSTMTEEKTAHGVVIECVLLLQNVFSSQQRQDKNGAWCRRACACGWVWCILYLHTFFYFFVWVDVVYYVSTHFLFSFYFLLWVGAVYYVCIYTHDMNVSVYVYIHIYVYICIHTYDMYTGVYTYTYHMRIHI